MFAMSVRIYRDINIMYMECETILQNACGDRIHRDSINIAMRKASTNIYIRRSTSERRKKISHWFAFQMAVVTNQKQKRKRRINALHSTLPLVCVFCVSKSFWYSIRSSALLTATFYEHTPNEIINRTHSWDRSNALLNNVQHSHSRWHRLIFVASKQFQCKCFFLSQFQSQVWR